MKTPSPTLVKSALVSAAGRKTRQVHTKLQQAESDMHAVNATLSQAAPARTTAQVDRAVRANEEAERKVHEATEELAVVKQLLERAESAARVEAPIPSGKTGHGVESLLEHLRTSR